jgi:transcriptional regulator with XRE-family HTH domain
MKDIETKLRCFKMRAEGKSLATIADTVGVRRQTVANWLNDHHEEVENLKAMELDALREARWMTTQAHIKRLSARHEKITAELEKRDFADVPTEKLLELERKTRTELAKEFAGPRIRSEEELRDAKATRKSPDLHPFSQMVKQGGDTTLLLEPEESGNGRKRPRRAD